MKNDDRDDMATCKVAERAPTLDDRAAQLRLARRVLQRTKDKQAVLVGLLDEATALRQLAAEEVDRHERFLQAALNEATAAS